MKRRGFLAMLGLLPLQESVKDPPICIGVFEGTALPIQCPEDSAKEKCPIGHLQEPSYTGMFVAAKRDDKSNYEIQAFPSHEIHVCSQCGVTYIVDVANVEKEK